MANNSTKENFIFHDNTNTIGNGNVFQIDNNAEVMNIEFITTGTFIAKIQAQMIDSTKWYPYPCFKLPSYDLIETTITNGNYLYNIDLIGISKIRIEITSITGTLTVLGKAVG